MNTLIATNIAAINTFALSVCFALRICTVESQTVAHHGGTVLSSVAVSTGIHGDDPGLGMEISRTVHERTGLAFRIRANLQWLEQSKAITDHWVTFQTYWAGVVYNTRIADRARPYFELGAFAIVPDQSFSKEKTGIGYYGATGLELFFIRGNNNVCLYLSVGGTRSHMRAERLEASPRYGTGIVFSNGFRYYLPAPRRRSTP
jgi:hypothetical protein